MRRVAIRFELPVCHSRRIATQLEVIAPPRGLRYNLCAPGITLAGGTPLFFADNQCKVNQICVTIQADFLRWLRIWPRFGIIKRG